MAEPGAVAPRPCEARDESLRDRVRYRIEHNRDCIGCPLRGDERRSIRGYDEFRLRRNEFGRLSSKPAGVGEHPAIVDLEIEAADPTQVPQPSFERLGAILIFWIGRITGQEHADSAGLLRARRERPRRRRAAKER